MPHDFSIYNVSDGIHFLRRKSPCRPGAPAPESGGQVYIISPGLMKKKGDFNPHTDSLPAGVDYWRYATPRPSRKTCGPFLIPG